jgi:hypothetical protein
MKNYDSETNTCPNEKYANDIQEKNANFLMRMKSINPNDVQIFRS